MRTSHFLIVACILASPLTHAGEQPAGNAASDAKISPESAIPSYVTAEQIRTMPPCEASVQYEAPCYSTFKTAGGKKFFIGSPAAEAEIVRFLRTLKARETYIFPRVFLAYQKKTER